MRDLIKQGTSKVRNLFRGPLKKIIENSGWLFIDTIFRYIVGIFISVWIARYFGPEDFGVYSYALAFTALFGAIAGLGLKGIVVRELVSHPNNKNEILGSAFLLLLFAGILTWGLSFIGIYLLRPNDSTSIVLVLIIGAGFIFRAFNSISFYFEAQVESKYTVIATNISFVVISVLKILLIITHQGLFILALISLIDVVLISINLIVMAKIKKLNIMQWKWNFNIAKGLLTDSLPLILSGILSTIFINIDQIMIGELVKAEEVGIYAVSVKLTAIWYIFPMIIQSSVYPNLVKTANIGLDLLYDKMHRLFSVLAYFSILVAIPISIFSKLIIELLYGMQYSEAADMLAISIWALIFVSFGVARMPYIIATGNMKMSIYFGLIGASVNVMLNLILIPIYGGEGAALATLLSFAASGYFSNFLFPSFFRIGKLMTRAIYAPSFKV